MADLPDYDTLLEFADTYADICLDNLQLVIDRYEGTSDYPYINTKLNLITGEDFAVQSPSLTIHSRQVIYLWIQGRGLESMAEHLMWLQRVEHDDRDELTPRLIRILEDVGHNLEKLRKRNGGRLPFMMSLDGQPLRVNFAGRVVPLKQMIGSASFSDLFCSKGLYAAGLALENEEWMQAGEDYFRQTIEAILDRKFFTDQQPMDPRNRVEHVPGRMSHGPYMIALSGVALMVENSDTTEGWADLGRQLIQQILDLHVNTGQYPQLQPYDYVEFVTNRGDLWWDNGRVICDPGHALEFIGLASKLLLLLPESPLHDTCREIFVPLLHHIFKLGFNEQVGGICKAYDLKARHPVNDDMPWWSLPETIRAAALVMGLCPQADPKACFAIIEKCHDALIDEYVNDDVYSMAVQTRNVRGEIVDVIPACPDADPCYHTGLSLLDAIDAIDAMGE